ncbi:kin of IRRE-like protein 1 isoform X1 [Branchiostoma lanceolatum]|uniref:kin of IRRE-like protein 1 isoform X1 n=1 Tax=Branchiostoma lanceolatum TaxID=7740 RepID=UPI0034529FE8
MRLGRSLCQGLTSPRRGMDSRRTEWAFLVILLVLSRVVKVHAVSYRVRPESMAVREGQTATLRCAFVGLTAQSVVFWEGPPNFAVISTGREVDPRYTRHRITGDPARGEYHLEIKDVDILEEGGYRCSTLGVTEKAEVNLNVVVPMKKPPKIKGRDVTYTAGQPMTLTCVATEGNPLPRLRWFNATKLLQQTSENAMAEVVSSVSLDLVIPEAARWDHGKNVTCVADQGFPDLTTTMASSTILNVHYPPLVRSRRQTLRATEGETLDLSCDVDSNPPAAVSWRKIDGEIPGNAENRGNELRLPKLSRSAAGGYKCLANNGIMPSGEGSITLIVLYPPRITSGFEDKTSALAGGEGFSLRCEAEGYPKPRVRWRRKGTKLYFDNPLEFMQIDYDMEGDYECVASNGQIRNAVRQTFVDVIGKPYINTVSLKVSVRSGDTARLVCEILSDPLPEETRWLRRGPGQQDKPVTASQRAGIRQEEKTSASGVTNTLVISHVGRSDGGVYVCETTNTFGTFQREFHMEVKATNTQAVVIASVTVIVLLVLFATIFICIAKRTGLSERVRREKASTPDLTLPRALPPLPSYMVPVGSDDVDDLELQDFKGTLKPRPPPRTDLEPYSIGLSYPSLLHPLPPYSTVERQRPDGEDNMVDSPYPEDPWETEVNESKGFVMPPSLPLKHRADKRINAITQC